MPNETKDRGRIRELTEKLETKTADINRISEGFVDETGNGQYVIPVEQLKDYRKAVEDAEEIKGLIDLEERRGGLNSFLGSAPGNGGPVAGQMAASGAGGMQGKSLGQMYLESDAYQEMKSSGFKRIGGTFEAGMGLSALEGKDIYSAMAGTIAIPGLGTPQNVGLAPRMLRPGRIRDLFPQDTTTANFLYGLRETGFINAAAVVPERVAANGGPATGASTDIFPTKPQSNTKFETVTYPVATIAHWMKAHKNTLADEPRMRGLIDRDLMDGVKLQEDWQLLYGPGGQDLTGLANTPGVQLYTGSNQDPLTAQIRRAITRVSLAYFVPTGVVMHVLDWESLELERDSYGQYRLAISVAMGGQKVVWRLPVVDTVAIQEGTFLTGAFGTGAKLFDREAVNVQISTETGNDFIENTVTIRAEERVAMTVDRPESFVFGTFTDPA